MGINAAMLFSKGQAVTSAFGMGRAEGPSCYLQLSINAAGLIKFQNILLLYLTHPSMGENGRRFVCSSSPVSKDYFKAGQMHTLMKHSRALHRVAPNKPTAAPSIGTITSGKSD